MATNLSAFIIHRLDRVIVNILCSLFFIHPAIYIIELKMNDTCVTANTNGRYGLGIFRSSGPRMLDPLLDEDHCTLCVSIKCV